MTVQQLINGAFFDMGATASGETPSSDESNDALTFLNSLLASWSTEQLTVFTETIASFTATGGDSSYTMGSGGDWNTTPNRAQKIVAWKAASGIWVAGGAPMSFADFDAASAKASADFAALTGQITGLLAPFRQSPSLLLSSAAVPLLLGADTAYPLLNVRIFPAVAATIEVTYWTPITAFAALGDTISLPQGFERALRLNLAVELSPQYAREKGIDPVLAANAQNAKAAIVQQNTPYPPKQGPEAVQA